MSHMILNISLFQYEFNKTVAVNACSSGLSLSSIIGPLWSIEACNQNNEMIQFISSNGILGWSLISSFSVHTIHNPKLQYNTYD